MLVDYLQKTKKEYTFLKKQEVHNINELEKACFQHDMAYRDFKDWATRTASNKILHDKAFNIAKNPKYDVYQKDLASIVSTCFDKRIFGSDIQN